MGVATCERSFTVPNRYPKSTRQTVDGGTCFPRETNRVPNHVQRSFCQANDARVGRCESTTPGACTGSITGSKPTVISHRGQQHCNPSDEIRTLGNTTDCQSSHSTGKNHQWRCNC